jgi:23S rRNA (cytidine1920-2'-O)/16S rRNA (cytidine1409-2'-O)-methyltransferase
MFDSPVDLAVADVSFISLRKILSFVIPCIRPGGRLLALIKPQFEATPKDIAKGGVLKNEVKREEIRTEMIAYATSNLGLIDVRTVDSTLAGPKGNREIFIFGTRVE